MAGSASAWDHQRASHEERRHSRRYRIRMDIRWKLLHRGGVLDRGAGWTCDLSSRGCLFEIERPLVPGSHVEISIAWPALLHGVLPMKLVFVGHVVRSEGKFTAIHLTQHEFRTGGSSAEQPKALAAGVSAAVPKYGLKLR